MKVSSTLYAVVFILGLAAFPHSASAYFVGTAGATGATASAGTLSLSLDNTSYAAPITAGSSASVSANVSSTGSIALQYGTAASNISCDPTTEGDLTLTATRDSSVVYTGPLAGFAVDTAASSGAWSFELALASGSAAAGGASCAFDIAFSAREAGMPANAGGFTSLQSLHISLTVVAPVAPPAPPPSITVTSVTPNTGSEAGGDTITIAGSGFTGATSVEFGTAPATIVSVAGDGSSVTVTSPATSTAGTVDVTVTTPAGTSAISAADTFTYTAP